MNREEYEGLPIDQKVNYINEQLQLGLRIKEISKALNCNESTLRKQINKAGYHMENGIYINHTKVIPEGDIDRIDYNITDLKAEEIVGMLKAKPELFMKVLARQMEDFSNRLGNIEERLKARHTNVNTSTISINIPDGEMKLVSFRLNEGVYKKWKQFTNKQKVYRSQDLLAMALIEYIEKYQ